jgi:hypothetical protein
VPQTGSSKRINQSPSKTVLRVDTAEIVHPSLLTELRRSSDQRKTETEAFHGEQFNSEKQVCYHWFFVHASAVRESVAVQKDIPGDHPSLSANVKSQPNLTLARSPEK